MNYSDKEMVKDVALALVRVIPFVVLTVCVFLYKKAKLLTIKDISNYASDNGHKVKVTL